MGLENILSRTVIFEVCSRIILPFQEKDFWLSFCKILPLIYHGYLFQSDFPRYRFLFTACLFPVMNV